MPHKNLLLKAALAIHVNLLGRFTVVVDQYKICEMIIKKNYIDVSLGFCSQEERARGDHNLQNIAKTHERMQQEAKGSTVQVTPYYKTKLKGLYNTAMQDAESEAE